MVLTGLGVIAPNGIGKDRFWESCLKGISATDILTAFDTTEYRTKIAAEVRDFDPADYMSPKAIPRMDRFAQFNLGAAVQAVADSGLDLEKENSERAGVCIGTGLGGMLYQESQIAGVIEGKSIRKLHPGCVPKITSNSAAAQVAIHFNLLGPNLTVSTACSSGTHAVGLARDMIQSNKADFVIAGGTEAPLAPIAFAGFNHLRVMSTNNESPKEASRPFDRDRDGFVMGEGAGVLVLEELEHARKRNARIYAEVLGYGSTCGGYHMVIPEPSGRDAARAMEMAIEDAGITAVEIDYINAHGTSTSANDKTETAAIKSVFRDHASGVGVSSTKSMIGHLIGAAGGVEAVACAMAMEHGVMPPTINYRNSDPDCDLDYVPNQPREKKINTVLSNSFGFGSNNACIVMRRLI